MSSFLALASLTGCARSDTVTTLPPGASMDGMFSVDLGPTVGVDGKPVVGSGASQTWAIRTACHDSGCVATVSVLAGGDPAKPPSYTTEFDFVDGKWLGVRETTGECNAKKDAPLWVADSLEPKPDGVITGKRWGIFVNDACTSSRTLTMKRTGDRNPAVAVADPEKSSARKTSPAAGFHGRYRATLVDKVIGETTSDVFYDVGTFCLRTGEKCITLFVSESRRSTLAYAFADAKWVTNPTPFPVKCDDGQDDKRTRTDVLTLPDPLRDPFQTVTGTVHTVDVGPCPLTMDLDATIERVGDSKPI